MIVLGIDPGSKKTGYALLEERGRSLVYLYSGIIDLSGEKEFLSKIDQLVLALKEIIKTHRPDEIALESLIFVKNPLSLIKLAQVRGAMLGVIAENYKEKVFEYPPNVVKSVTVGYGHAPKEAIQKMLRPLVGGSHLFLSDDESDAVAVALCHILQKKSGPSGADFGKSSKSRKKGGLAQSLNHCQFRDKNKEKSER